MNELLADLPVNLSHHLKITLVALLAGVVISVPLAVYLVRRPRLRYPVLTATGIVQTIPGLALLALMVPLLVFTGGLGLGLSAFGFYPAVFALALYSLLPILRNTVTGILEVDANMTEAARGVGMSPWQVLTRVELPLAAPVIIAGIRTATVWTVGAATLATPVGQTCLGNYIFAGLQTKNWSMVLFGVVCAAGLAVLLDFLIGALEYAAATRRRRIGWSAGLSLGLVVLVGLVAPAAVRAMQSPQAPSGTAAVGSERDRVNRVVIGAKTFTEQYILAELISRRLRAAGVEVRVADSLGSTVVFDALANGDVDVYVDYSGTIWANHMERDDIPPRWQVLAEVNRYLAVDHSVRNLGPLGFENTYAFAVRAETAAEFGLETVSELAPKAPGMRIGSDYEFFGRPEWRSIRGAYDLRFKEKRTLDATFMYDALVTNQVDVITAFSSDGRIAAHGLKLLEDSAGAIPPYDALLLLGPRVADDGRVVRALQPLIRAIDVATMQRANWMVDREQDKRTVGDAAGWLDRQIDARQ